MSVPSTKQSARWLLGSGPLAVRLWVVIATIGCASAPPAGRGLPDSLIEKMHQPAAAPARTNQMLEIVQGLPESAIHDQLGERIDEILREMRRATRRDLPHLREGFVLLRRQPAIVEVIADTYENAPEDAFALLAAILGLLGELQREDAFEFFRGVAWTELPPRSEGPVHGLTDRDFAKILQRKAVQGMAFIRDGDGEIVEQVEDELVELMLSHPARTVRIAAIDSYMWNRGDTPAAAKALYQVLPEEYQQFVERPRFARGAHAASFNAKLDAWRARWAK